MTAENRHLPSDAHESIIIMPGILPLLLGGQARQRCLMRKQAGFTLVEMLVVIGVIAILMTIIAPTLRSVTVRTEMVICKSNLHHLGIGLTAYQAEHKNRFMPFRKWILGNSPSDINGISNGLI